MPGTKVCISHCTTNCRHGPTVCDVGRLLLLSQHLWYAIIKTKISSALHALCQYVASLRKTFKRTVTRVQDKCFVFQIRRKTVPAQENVLLPAVVAVLPRFCDDHAGALSPPFSFPTFLLLPSPSEFRLLLSPSPSHPCPPLSFSSVTSVRSRTPKIQQGV